MGRWFSREKKESGCVALHTTHLADSAISYVLAPRRILIVMFAAWNHSTLAKNKRDLTSSIPKQLNEAEYKSLSIQDVLKEYSENCSRYLCRVLSPFQNIAVRVDESCENIKFRKSSAFQKKR